MLDGVAYRCAEREQDDLRNREERRTEDNVSNWPAVLKRAEYEDELRDDVDHRADQRPQDIDDPQAERLVVLEAGEALECRNCNKERDSEYDEAGYPEELSLQ